MRGPQQRPRASSGQRYPHLRGHIRSHGKRLGRDQMGWLGGCLVKSANWVEYREPGGGRLQAAAEQSCRARHLAVARQLILHLPLAFTRSAWLRRKRWVVFSPENSVIHMEINFFRISLVGFEKISVLFQDHKSELLCLTKVRSSDPVVSPVLWTIRLSGPDKCLPFLQLV